MSVTKITADFAKYVSKYKARFYKRFGIRIIMQQRNGIYFEDVGGHSYINCHCNGGVFNLGHRNHEVVAALEESLSYYDIGNHHFISNQRALLAKELVQSLRLPGSRSSQSPLNKVTFAVSGGEAIDFAIKLARGYTRRTKIVSLKGGYHGHTGLALAAGDAKYRNPFNIHLKHFEQINLNDEVELERALDSETAALIFETVPATLGMQEVSVSFMRKARTLCTRKGIVFILDEIQTGLSRTGKRWAFHHYDIEPDVMVTGKGLSGGIYPIAATCYRSKYESLFKKDAFIHISTFGGAELACVTARKVLAISFADAFLENVNNRADFFKSQMVELIKSYPEIKEFRQLGLFMAITLDSHAKVLTLLKVLMTRGIFAVYANNDKNTIQFLPPLIIDKADAQEIIHRLEMALQDMSRIKYRVMKKIISLLVRS